MERKIGEEVSWCGVSRIYSGKITGFHKLGYIVTMPSGKCVIVDETSIIKKP